MKDHIRYDPSLAHPSAIYVFIAQKCTICSQSFLKHHQMRTHNIQMHQPIGTLPYPCTAGTDPPCMSSFSTAQHLRSHLKTHEVDRYMCSDASCLKYFGTWSALQAHMRSAHPYVCIYPSCLRADKPFVNLANLKAHLKLHNAEETVEWPCDYGSCTKAFKTERSRKTHIERSHLLLRPFICSEKGCGQSFGYNHLLKRHAVKVHENSMVARHDEEKMHEPLNIRDTA